MIIASIVCYAIACVLPVFREEDMKGFQALYLGWMGLFAESDTLIFLSWLANIVYIIMLVTLWRNKKISFTLGIITILLGICFSGVDRILVSEGGATEKVSPGIAFPLWILSFVVATVAGALILRKKI